MGTVDGCGYDSQLKYTICEACRPCHMILSILRPVFHQLRQICCTFESLRCLNPKIWRFFVDHNDNNDNDNDNNNDNDTTNYFTPCACARGNNMYTWSDRSHVESNSVFLLEEVSRELVWSPEGWSSCNGIWADLVSPVSIEPIQWMAQNIAAVQYNAEI